VTGPRRPLEEDNPDPALILHSKSFQHSLLAMERNILANIYQSRLAAYRQLPALALQGEHEPSAPLTTITVAWTDLLYTYIVHL